MIQAALLCPSSQGAASLVRAEAALHGIGVLACSRSTTQIRARVTRFGRVETSRSTVFAALKMGARRVEARLVMLDVPKQGIALCGCDSTTRKPP
jgi:hypothetical protein